MIEVDTDVSDFKAIARRFAEEANGAKLRAALAKNIREAVRPVVIEVKAQVMAMHSGGLPSAGGSLRSVVANNVETTVRYGATSGVRVRAKKGGPRGFRNAPQRLNRPAGWRHPVYGRDVWVHQVGAPNWFDGPLSRAQDRYRVAVRKAMEDMAQRLSNGG